MTASAAFSRAIRLVGVLFLLRAVDLGEPAQAADACDDIVATCQDRCMTTQGPQCFSRCVCIETCTCEGYGALYCAVQRA